jgi:putative restriction endonuclease
MDSLERALIEKAGYGNGFENVRESTPEQVRLFSARHPAQVRIFGGGRRGWRVAFDPPGPWNSELARTFPDWAQTSGEFAVEDEIALCRLLRRAAEFASALPQNAALQFAEAIRDAAPLESTESMSLVKVRIGQNLFREALLNYWGGACAVTGVALPELLRASHAKPWAECVSDAERLDVFNGLLLCAHLDALFDRGLLCFDSRGEGLLSERIDPRSRELLGLGGGLRLRWIAREHQPFLEWHRSRVFGRIEPAT